MTTNFSLLQFISSVILTENITEIFSLSAFLLSFILLKASGVVELPGSIYLKNPLRILRNYGFIVTLFYCERQEKSHKVQQKIFLAKKMFDLSYNIHVCVDSVIGLEKYKYKRNEAAPHQPLRE